MKDPPLLGQETWIPSSTIACSSVCLRPHGVDTYMGDRWVASSLLYVCVYARVSDVHGLRGWLGRGIIRGLLRRRRTIVRLFLNGWDGKDKDYGHKDEEK